MSERLHPEDITLIIEGVSGRTHSCRFPGIEPNDLTLVVDFVKSLKSDAKENRRVVRKVLITMFITTVSGLTLAGIVVYLRDKLLMVIK